MSAAFVVLILLAAIGSLTVTAVAVTLILLALEVVWRRPREYRRRRAAEAWIWEDDQRAALTKRKKK